MAGHSNILPDHLSWFYEHLHNLATASSVVNVALYVTSEGSTANQDGSVPAMTESAEMQIVIENPLPEDDIWETDTTRGLLGGSANKGVEHIANVEYRRMNVESILHDAMQAVEGHQRVLIVTCGPKSLMDTVRDCADRSRRTSDCRIDVHCEDFNG